MTEEMQNRQADTAAEGAAEIISGADGTPEKNEPFKTFATREEYQQYFDKLLGQRLKGARKNAERLEAMLKEKESAGAAEQEHEPAEHPQSFEALKKELSALAREDDAVYGSIDPDEAAADRKFTALLSHGFSVKEAYDALHLEEITQKLAAKAEHQIICNILARGSRPSESAAAGAAAGAIYPNVAAMNNDEIDAVLERVRRGESISF